MVRNFRDMGWAAGLVTVLSLAACGGGGGGGDSGGSDGGQALSGLMPAAPAIGASLFQDASVLRPVSDGARYDYRGQFTSASGATPTVYLNTVRQTASGANFNEIASNALNQGDDVSVVSVAGGTVSMVGSLDLTGTGAAVIQNPAELQSPVRQGDRYTLIDQHLDAVVDDLDGDGKKEALDIAVYRQIGGMEDVALENIGTVSALRADLVLISRVRASASGSYLPMVTATQSTWYREGVGVVRMRLDSPNDAGTDRQITDERLVRWDGLTAGLGYTDSQNLTVAADGGVWAGTRLTATWNKPTVLGMDDHALVVTNNPQDGGFAANVVNMRGVVTSTKLYSGYYMTGWPQLVRVGHSAVMLAASGQQIQYLVMDDQGTATSAWPPATLDLGPGNRAGEMNFAGTSDRVWAQWTRSVFDIPTNSILTEIVVRPFSPAGQWLAAETVVARTGGLGAFISLSASDDKVLLAWPETDAQAHTLLRMAWLPAADQPFQLSVLADPVQPSAALQISGTAGRFTLTWACALANTQQCDEWRGVVVDVNGQVRRSVPAAALDQELLTGFYPAADRVISNQALSQADRGGQTVLSVGKTSRLWADDAVSSLVTEVNWLDVTNSPLATATATRQTRRLPGTGGLPTATVLFDDRALLISNSGNLTSTVVWRR